MYVQRFKTHVFLIVAQCQVIVEKGVQFDEKHVFLVQHSLGNILKSLGNVLTMFFMIVFDF